MKKIVYLMALVSSLLHAGPVLTEEVKALLVEAKTKVEGVSASQVHKIMKNTVLLDVRDPDEWKQSIDSPKQVRISRGFLEIKYPKLILNKYSKNDSFIVYCALEPRSVLAASRLKELGFTDVKYLIGGFKNWKKENYPTTK